MGHAATILVSSSQPWWQTLIESASAVGAVAAAVAAWWAARRAQQIAKDDRQAAIEREQDERSYDRDQRALQQRLDLVLAAARSLEVWYAVPPNHTDSKGQAQGELVAALNAMIEPAELSRQFWVRGGSLTEEQAAHVERDYGIPRNEQAQIRVARAELQAIVADLRLRLYGEDAVTFKPRA